MHARRNIYKKTDFHHTQLLLEQIRQAFDEVRAVSGLYKNTKSPPTLHESRSLGASLYREAGWPEGQVQLLLGNSEIQMTRSYLAGHEAPWE